MATDKKPILFKIKRSEGPGQPSRWEEFEVPWEPQMNVISALMEVQKNPVTTSGQKVAPVVWESSCLEEVCGACTMVINGRVRQACSTLVDQLCPNGETLVIEPMTKFPLVRDLVVDRTRMFDALRKRDYTKKKAANAADPTTAPKPAETKPAEEAKA